jgi:hypothetical protein
MHNQDLRRHRRQTYKDRIDGEMEV